MSSCVCMPYPVSSRWPMWVLVLICHFDPMWVGSKCALLPGSACRENSLLLLHYSSPAFASNSAHVCIRSGDFEPRKIDGEKERGCCIAWLPLVAAMCWLLRVSSCAWGSFAWSAGFIQEVSIKWYCAVAGGSGWCGRSRQGGKRTCACDSPGLLPAAGP